LAGDKKVEEGGQEKGETRDPPTESTEGKKPREPQPTAEYEKKGRARGGKALELILVGNSYSSRGRRGRQWTAYHSWKLKREKRCPEKRGQEENLGGFGGKKGKTVTRILE